MTALVATPAAAAADPSATEPSAAGETFTIQPFYAPIEADGDAVPQAARTSLAPAEEREPTAEDARDVAERQGDKSFSGAGQGTALAPSGARRPPAVPDESYLDPCWDSDNGRGEYGRVYNRFAWCQRGRIGGEVRDEDDDVVGTVSIIFRAAAYGRDDGNRDVRVFLRTEPGSADYQAFFPWDEASLRSAIMHLWVDCDNFLDGCSAGGATAGKTMDEWDRDGSWHSWTVASANAGDGLDKVKRHLWHFKSRVFSSVLPGVPAKKIAQSHTMRCDSASVGFALSRSKACVFDDVIPHLQYSAISAKHGEVARHIQCALDPGCTSWPLKDGKQVPGKFVDNRDAPGLHRITEKVPSHPDGVTYYSRNSYQKDQACQQGTPYFALGLPAHLYKPPAQQCDEFPFASTREGAGVGDWNFSVLGVTAAVNGCAGRELQRYYRDDRILVWQPGVPTAAEDEFFVHITDAPDTGDPAACEEDPDEGGDPDQPPTVNAGQDVSGDEGSVITLSGSASDAETTPTTGWTYAPGPGTDPGAACSFTAEGSTTTGITCTDDGTYTVTLSANDGVNGSVSDSATVTVHNVAPAVGGPQPATMTVAPTATSSAGIVTPTPWQVFRVGQSVKLTANFTDPGLNDTHVCSANWDDGTSQTFTSRGRQCVREHTYTAPGMYTISTGVADDDDGIADAASVMVIVYDPEGGFSTQGGFLDSPAGALTGAPNVAGKLTFTFNPKYLPGEAGPVPGGGKVSASLQGASFDLDSTALEWLVVTLEDKVAVKGTGTVNGVPGYGFVAYGFDDPDASRLVVWPLSAGQYPQDTVLYDNRGTAGYDLDMSDPQPLAGGSLQVHQ
ncbi:PKD domain-containing protein [Micromonospora sp. RHAY321]|uniref:NucA/NucB deoxyribonuclease domain-containing protein n=1 Tax=Micromonospora sp. RHAY321 TaxID=2944807 RepID=UPI00207D0DF8|nr:PKD domain-containing protein [Micromonospora sp. RHAY321]MCO1597065.1 PKD domain-containing protein [Micromonospora sp. RHAY321]